ncbi:hypothetical protein [Streptomyces chiangmaiensis]|uniref:LysR substrate-binding domain-containing protein n=1 Tax=Streptomyces chiangmaiensis TaxID=766497 RepID=A0ABU7FI65_9ACTN|nr:hypothetical protein [Streptomyces chiangmaiensis]MED7823053.1 hypothetical protein [Streptomyces chiangmaiensis]
MFRTSGQLSALRAGELDVGLLRERPRGQECDAMLVNREPLGVLLSANRQRSSPELVPAHS